MTTEPSLTYSPLNTLKSVAENVWIVDGPLIWLGSPWSPIPFPTRMTVLRLGARDLFIHSPTKLIPSLKVEIERVGEPRWIVAPNRLHYWWVPDWRNEFRDVDIFVAPKAR